MWFKLSQIILRYRVTILTIIAALTIMFGYYAFTSLKIDNKYGTMLPKDAPAQVNYMKLKQMFGDNSGALIIAIQTDSLFTEDNFLAWKRLGDTISHIPGVKSVFSVAKLVNIINNKKEHKFEIEPIFKDTTFKTKSIEQIKKEIFRVPIFNGLLYNDSTHVSLMMVNVKESFLSNQKKMGVVFDIENVAKHYEKRFGEMHFSGMPHIRVVLGRRVVNEMYLFIGLCIFVTSIILYLLFRSFRVVIFSNIVVFTAVIWALGSIAMMGYRVSILMALIPPLMIIIGIPNCVYLLNNFHTEVLLHGNKTKALSRVITKIGYATFLTNLTIAIGFFALVFTNSDKLMEFGISSTVNILFAFFLAITIIPIVFSFSGTPKRRHLKHLDQGMSKRIAQLLVDTTVHHRKWIYGIAFVVTAICVWGATLMRATGSLTSDLSKGDQIYKDIHYLQKSLKGVIPFDVLVNFKDKNRMFNSHLLRKIETVQDNLAQDTLLSKSISIVDFMKYINMAYYGNNPYMYQLIKRRDLLRLREYLENFQKDVQQKKQLSRYQDSVINGDLAFADSILMNYPKVAALYMNYQPQPDTTDSLEAVNLLPSIATITAFVDSNQILPQKVLKISKKAYPSLAAGLSLNDLVDTATNTYRIRMQIADLGSNETKHEIKKIASMLDTVLNPNYKQAMAYFKQFEAGKTSYADSIFSLSNAYRNNVSFLLTKGNDSLRYQMNLNPDLLATYYKKDGFGKILKQGIEQQKLEYTITGTAAVIAQGTDYLIFNLITSIIIAVIVIAALMATLFFDYKMVLISLVPNIIPQIVTAGLMGFLHIPLKPSTLLIFSISFGISVDNTIRFLTKYKQELKERKYDLKTCILNALYDTGISMYYTAIILICGFTIFAFSKFGGTRALGLLTSITLLFGGLANLFVLPALLLSVEKKVSGKAYGEPLFNVYDEEIDVEVSQLKISDRTRIDKNPPNVPENE